MKEIAEIIDKDISTITSLINKLIVLDYAEQEKEILNILLEKLDKSM
jgi:predicted transcriptional regulator